MTNRFLSKMPEIKLPFPTVQAKFGREAAIITAKLHNSRAAETAKNTSIAQGHWSVGWETAIPAATPAAQNAQEYLAAAKAATRTYLILRLAKWKGHVELTEIPPQIAVKLEEQAQLVGGQTKNPAVDKAPAAPAPAPAAPAPAAAGLISTTNVYHFVCAKCSCSWSMEHSQHVFTVLPETVFCPWCGLPQKILAR